MKLGLPRLLCFLGLLLSSVCPLFSAEVSGASPLSSESLFKSAAEKIERRQYEEARKIYDQILTESSDEKIKEKVLLQKAQSYERESKYGQAEEIYRQGVDRFKQNPQWLERLGYAQGRQGKYDQAYQTFQRILTEHPNDPIIPFIHSKIALFQKTQQRLLDALEIYLMLFETYGKKDIGIRSMAQSEVSNCLQLLDLPLEKAAWDEFVANSYEGKNPILLSEIRKKSWPSKPHPRLYKPVVQKVLASGPDVWAEGQMQLPEGPTYESIQGLLEPLGLINASFHFYPIILSTPGGTYKARLAGNGNQIGVGLDWVGAQSENSIWWKPRLSFHFYVGEDQGRFGDDSTQRKGPVPLKGYLPVYTTEYTHEGKTYTQQVFAMGTSPMTIKVALTVPAGGKLSILVEDPKEGIGIHENQIQDENGWALCAVQNAKPERHPKFSQFGWIEVAPKTEPQTIYLSIPCDKLALLPAPTEEEFHQDVRKVAGYWDKLLGQGAQIDVPEKVVMNAWRSLLISNYQMTIGNGMLYSAGNYYGTSFIYEVTRPVVAFALYGHQADALNYFDSVSQIGSGEFHKASQVWTAYELYLLGESEGFLKKRLKRFKERADELNEARKANEKGLQPIGVYAGDIGYNQAYSLDHNLGAYRAIRDFGLLLKALGEKEEGERYYQEAQEYRKVILKAIDDSMVKDSKPSFIPQALYGSEKPYGHLASDPVGSYYNIVMSRIQDTGVFGPHDPYMDTINYFLEQRGGRMLGLLRFNQHTPLYVGDGVDDTYQIEYDKSLLLRGEIDRFLAGFYGKLAHGMTRDTFVGAEIVQVAPEEGENYRRMYLPPNSTTNAHFLFDLRNMLVLEEDEKVDGMHNRLDLLKGTPRGWLEAGKKIAFSDMPTYFGDASLLVKVSDDGKTVQGEIHLPSKRPFGKVILHLRRPKGMKLKEVLVNGESARKFDLDKEEIDLSGYKGRVTVLAKY